MYWVFAGYLAVQYPPLPSSYQQLNLPLKGIPCCEFCWCVGYPWQHRPLQRLSTETEGQIFPPAVFWCLWGADTLPQTLKYSLTRFCILNEWTKELGNLGVRLLLAGAAWGWDCIPTSPLYPVFFKALQ